MAKWAFGSQFVQQGFRLFEDLLVKGGITQKVRKTALDFGFCKHKTLLETKMETPRLAASSPSDLKLAERCRTLGKTTLRSIHYSNALHRCRKANVADR